jgi:probable phosphoglycerate mutase
MTRKLVFLARHGETDWNVQGRWQGHTDIPLNEKGREQARRVAVALRGAGVSGLVSSDLSRAHETARIVGAELGLDVAYVDADLRERMLGAFEGLTREECEQRHPVAWRAWLDEQRPPSDGEQPETVAVRVIAAIGRAVDRLVCDGAPALVVTHGGALRAAIRAATGVLPGPIANCAIWRIEWANGIAKAEPVP